MRRVRALVALVLLLAVQLCCAQLNTRRVMEIGRNALYFEDYVLSIQYFNQVIDAKPFLHEPYFYRALAKFYLEDYSGAEQDLDTAILKNPYISRCYQLRGLCRANMDSLLSAETDFRKALRFNPHNDEVWQNLGAVAMQLEDWDKAAIVLDSMLLFYPRNSRAYLMRTQVALNVKDTLTAQKMVERAVQYDKYSADVYDARAVVRSVVGEYEAAEQDLDKAIELLPNRSGSYINRALVRYNRNDLRGAMEDYDMALYVEPASFVAHYNRGILRMNVGDDNRAIEDFDWVLGVDPDNTLARFNRGLLFQKTGDYRRAVEDFTTVIEDYPNFEYAYQCRAESYREMGDERGAKSDEEWLLKRQYDIFVNGSEAVAGEYVASEDNTRKSSDKNVRNYNKMISADVADSKNYTTEYRGRVQDRNVYVELEPIYVLSYYEAGSELEMRSNYYKPLEDMNASLAAAPLLLTNNERALAEQEVVRHFASIDALSRDIANNPSDALLLMRRALDYYLVQDLEESMKDVDAAITAVPDSWALYFVRAFVRYRLLEVLAVNETHEASDGAVATSKFASGLSGVDFRVVKEDLDKVVELVPDFAYAYFNRANVSTKASDFKSAIVDYTKAISLNDRFAEAYYNRGLAKIYTGNTEGGIADLSKAGELGIFQAYNLIKRFKFNGER